MLARSFDGYRGRLGFNLFGLPRLTLSEAAGACARHGIAALGLSQHLSHFPGELSLGLARRVAIARAFAISPDLLLLDEPFVSLDAALALRLRAELLALVEARKVTTLLVTHDIDEAIALADRIVILSRHPGSTVADRVIETPRRAMTPPRAEKAKAEIEALIAGAAG